MPIISVCPEALSGPVHRRPLARDLLKRRQEMFEQGGFTDDFLVAEDKGLHRMGGFKCGYLPPLLVH